MKKVLKFAFVFYMIIQLLHAYDTSDYEADTSEQSAEDIYHMFTDKKEADVYFGKYYQLISAIEQGNLAKVTKLVEDIGTESKVAYVFHFHSPLVYAVRNEKLKIARYLLEHEANPNRYMDVHNTRITALMFAASSANHEIVDTLLAYGADANMVDEDGYTALGHALEHNFGMSSMANEEIIKQLIPLTTLNKETNGRFTWGSNDRGKPATVLTIAFRFHRSDVIIDMLLDAGATAGKSDVAIHAFLKAFIKYISRYKDPNKIYEYCKTALAQTRNSNDKKIETDLVYLYTLLHETAIITNYTLTKEEQIGFETLVHKNAKAKAYLEWKKE